jgi:hypothetical protein
MICMTHDGCLEISSRFDITDYIYITKRCLSATDSTQQPLKRKPMNKSLTVFFAVICSFILTTSAQIPNPGFENWTAGDPNGWATSNVFPAGLVTVTQTSDSHSGSLALRGDVVNFLGTPMAPIIQSGPGGTGFPISERYLSFECWYKFTSVGGDKFSVNIGLEKGGNAIAQGAVALPANVGSYFHLTVPLNYTTSETPDLAIIQISITGPVTGPDVHVGSVMFLDDLVFSLSTGTGTIPGPGLAGNCYPNPASDVLNINTGEQVSGEVTLEVFDVSGKEVKSVRCYPQQNRTGNLQLSVADLAPGLYFYSVSAPNERSQGKFSVKR